MPGKEKASPKSLRNIITNIKSVIQRLEEWNLKPKCNCYKNNGNNNRSQQNNIEVVPISKIINDTLKEIFQSPSDAISANSTTINNNDNDNDDLDNGKNIIISKFIIILLSVIIINFLDEGNEEISEEIIFRGRKRFASEKNIKGSSIIIVEEEELDERRRLSHKNQEFEVSEDIINVCWLKLNADTVCKALTRIEW